MAGRTTLQVERLEGVLRITYLLICGLLVGCGATVDTAEDGGGSSADGQQGGQEPHAGGRGGADPVGGGGAGTIGPFECSSGDGAIVAATSSGSTRATVMTDGNWTEPPLTLAPAWRIATFVDVFQHLGVFWVGTDQDPPNAHYAVTFDGVQASLYDTIGWSPLSYGVLQPAWPFMVGSVEGGTEVAYMDADTFDWYPMGGTSDLVATSAASPATGDVYTVGIEDGVLCDQQFISFETWGSKQCHFDHPVVELVAGEVPVTQPQVLALPDGRVVVVYYTPQSSLALAVSEREEGGWSTGVDTTSIGPQFAAVATPSSEVLVFTTSFDGLHALRYSPSQRQWTGDFVIDEGADFSSLTAATGVCGDDALVTYSTGLDAEVRIVRVRGEQSETRTLFQFVETQPYQLSVTTRRAPPI